MKTKYTTLLGAALLLTGCSSEDGLQYSLSADGQKTPITVTTNIIKDAAAQTRAVDGKFDAQDVLKAYVQTVTKDANNVYNGNNSGFSRLIDFTVNEDNVASTSNLTPVIYWDDFSNSTTDLNTNGNGIRLFYGYCYNGGTPTDALVNATGQLTWKVATDQSTGYKSSDLLWASTQDALTYTHTQADLPSLNMPFSHAMSKMTIVVNADETFTEDTPLANTQLTLSLKNTVAACNAPASTITASVPANIKMCGTEINTKSYSYAALFAPSALTTGNTLATISDVAGNNYTLTVTEAMLAADKWGRKLTSVNTQSGVNYLLTVNISKQGITVNASVADWEQVAAEGEGLIQFTGDVTTKGTIATELQDNGFDVYKKGAATNATYTKATTLSYDQTSTSHKWIYAPVIYWQNSSDDNYFRAISPKDGSATTVTNGEDLLWGTSGSDIITPRTGDVGLDFTHLMSKVVIKLETTTGDDQVTLTDAKIKIDAVPTGGTYDMHTGEVTAGTTTEVITTSSEVENILTPHVIDENTKIKVTLADGTTYSLLLKDCMDGPEPAWASGKSYTYTITLKKTAITFKALVQAWDDVTGSGDATMDWD